MSLSMQFDAVAEAVPGDKWLSRWDRSWPAYRQWFLQRGGDMGPTRDVCEAALATHMPELLPTWKSLCTLSGNEDLAARFLSTWCPPTYLGGCSLAALSANGTTRLVRNYDLSPDLNEGLLLRTEWTGTQVMGMTEFLWGLSDGVNQHGLSVALAYGGNSKQVGVGFGITTILRYVMETCRSVEQALNALERIPSHMAYNVLLADESGTSASVEMKPGGGIRVTDEAVATNHQYGSIEQGLLPTDRAAFTKTYERFEHLKHLLDSDIAPESLADEFMKAPLFQYHYAEALGTLFTADYDPVSRSLDLRWTDKRWSQSLDNFQEKTQRIDFSPTPISDLSPDTTAHHAWLNRLACIEPYVADRKAFLAWLTQARSGNTNWSTFSGLFSSRQ